MPGKHGRTSLPVKVGGKSRGKASLSSVQTTKKFSPGSDNNLASSVFER